MDIISKIPTPDLSGTNWKKILGFSLLGLFCVIFLWIVIFGIGIYKAHWENKVARLTWRIVPYPAAIASFNVVTVNDFYKELDFIKHFYAETKQKSPDEKTLRSQILDQMIEWVVLENEARRYGIRVSSAEVDSEYQKIATENGGVSEIRKIISELYGMDETNFKKLIKSLLIKEKLKEELPIKIHAYHILIKVPENADQKTIDDARNKIAGILKEINEKKISFEDQAKKYSEDEATKDKSGDLGWFEKGQHDADFDKAAFALRKGEISDPVKTKFGWHIIKIEDRKGKVEKSFADWYDELIKKVKIWKLM